MIAYYKSRGEDPKYSGLWEQKFAKNFQNLWEMVIPMQLQQELVQFMWL